VLARAQVVKEVPTNVECGVDVNGINTFKQGDIIECFEVTR
jgi:hypothetical protein